MSRYFAISTGSSTIQLKNNRTGSVTFTVTNNADEGIKTRAKISVLDAGDGAWFTIQGEKERDYKEKTQQYTVSYAIPNGVSPGSYRFRMDVFGVENPDEIYSEGPVVQMQVLDAEAPPKSTPFPWWIIAVVVSVLLMGGGIAWWATRTTTELVPRVIGQTADQAKAMLAEKKFTVEETTVFTVKHNEINVVMAQDPVENTEADQGSTVTITLGKAGVKVPVTIGDSVEGALKKITDAGLSCRIGASTDFKKKLGDYKKSLSATAAQPGAVPQRIGDARTTAMARVNIVAISPFIGGPKVSKTDPPALTVVGKDSTVTLFLETSRGAKTVMLKKSELEGSGIHKDLLETYSN